MESGESNIGKKYTEHCKHNHSHKLHQLQLDGELRDYLQETSRDPQTSYEYITKHRGLISQQNLDQLALVVKFAIEEAQDQFEYALSKDPNSDFVQFVQLAKFFFFKFCVMKFCIEYGVDKFFETHLCSDPPDDVVLSFQKELVLWTPESFLERFAPLSPTSTNDGSSSPTLVSGVQKQQQ